MSPYKKFIIYYFSGTGNSQNVAKWMSVAANGLNIGCELVNIGTIDRANITAPPPEALIAFISPVHGFNYPPIMLHFIWRFPKGRNNVLLMNTRAGMLIGKWNTPGLSGMAFYLSLLILKLKGFAIKAMYPIDLPSNWISLHPGLNKKAIEYIHKTNKEKVIKFAQIVLNGGSNYKAIGEIAQDIAVTPVSVLYYLVGRFALAKTFYASSDCNKCDICIKNCPVKAIIKLDNRPFWTFKCESCMQCMNHCPKRAIETGHGFFIGVIILNSMVISILFYNYFSSYIFEIKSEALKFVINPVIFLSLIFITHRLIHYLMRFRVFEWLMVYTSLTKLKFWKRYKALQD